MEQLKNMKTKLVDCVEKQINGNLEYANAQELGEAVDMIKDLSEAIYYCTITEAMDDKSQWKNGDHQAAAHYYGGYDQYSPMYASNSGNGGNRNYTPMYASNGQGGTNYYSPVVYASDGNAQSRGESRNYTPMYAGNGGYMYHDAEYGYPHMIPEHEARSSMAKRRYMDGKRQNDKQMQMRELEQYTQELAQDITDMIKDASPEERQLLQQKINLLASKIK